MPTPLTLCFVADASNIHARRWLSFFVGRGHKVFCLSDKPGEIPGVTVLALPNRDTLLQARRKAGKMAVLRARVAAIREALADIQPDILHAHFLYQRGWSAALSSFHPLVITLLGSDVYLPEKHYRNRWHLTRDRLLNAYALQQADLVTGVSERLCQSARRILGQSGPVELVPIGIDPDRFKPIASDNPRLRTLRESLQIAPEDFVVLSPRQMTPLYNIETLLDAVPAVLEKAPRTVFILKDAFCDTDERKRYVETLKARADSLGVSAAVRWASEVTYEDLPLFYNLANAVVSIPSTDGMPVTLFEAMACETPVIVGDLPAYDAVIVHRETGLRVPIQNSPALADAILQLIRNPLLSHSLVEGARDILQRYGIFDEQMLRMETLYYQLAAAGPFSRSSFKRNLNTILNRCLLR